MPRLGARAGSPRGSIRGAVRDLRGRARQPRAAAASRSWTCAPPAGFAGTEPEPRAGLRGGHIPGSRNLPFHELVAPGRDAAPGRCAPRAGSAAAGVDPSAADRRHLRLGHQRLRPHPRAPRARPRHRGALRRLVDRMGRAAGHAGGDGTGVTRRSRGPPRTPRRARARLHGAVPAAVRGGRACSPRSWRVRAASASDWKQAGFLAIFMLTFGGVGIGGIAAVFAGRRQLEEGQAREARQSGRAVALARGLGLAPDRRRVAHADVVRVGLRGAVEPGQPSERGSRRARGAQRGEPCRIDRAAVSAGRRGPARLGRARHASLPALRCVAVRAGHAAGRRWATRSRAPCATPAGLRPPRDSRWR